MKKTLGFVIAVVSALTIGCGPDNNTSTTSSSSSGGGSGMGSLTVRVSGGKAAKVGFPVDDNGTITSLADGWSIQFSKVLVSFGAIDVHGTDGAMGVTSTDRYIVDLHDAVDATVPAFEGLAARQWEHFGFEVTPPDATTIKLNTVEDNYIQTMTAGKYNYFVEGTATKGAESIPFVYGIPGAVKNTDCKNDGASGIQIYSDMTTEAEISIHIAHVFFDALENEAAALRFDAMAAVKGADNKITIDEIASQQLGSLKDASGMPLKDGSGNPVVYNTGTVQLPTQDLLAFVQASTAAMAHLNGKGMCTTTGL